MSLIINMLKNMVSPPLYPCQEVLDADCLEEKVEEIISPPDELTALMKEPPSFFLI